jgi:hypothetical protein
VSRALALIAAARDSGDVDGLARASASASASSAGSSTKPSASLIASRRRAARFAKQLLHGRA